MVEHPLSKRIADVLSLQDARALEFEGHWHSWGEIEELARGIESLDVRQREIGILLRNTPAHVATLLGVLMSGGTVVVINPALGDHRITADVDSLHLPLIVGTRDDLSTLMTPAGDTTTVAISGLADPPRVCGADDQIHAAGRPDVAVRMLTSGTTGPPKRIDLTYDMLARSVIGTDFDVSASPTQLRSGVAIVNTSAACSGCFSVSARPAHSRCWTVSS